MTNKVKIQRDSIPSPHIVFTKMALQQLSLIIENDFTLEGLYFRLLISGKGCDGFNYSSGFTPLNDDDFIVPLANEDTDVEIVMDPFTAFYLNEAKVDYVQNFEKDEEGFVITNMQQKKYHGKFWIENSKMMPPLEKDKE